jgi:hypothetical protein
VLTHPNPAAIETRWKIPAFPKLRPRVAPKRAMLAAITRLDPAE